MAFSTRMVEEPLRLLARDLSSDLSSFHLVHYGPKVHGFLISAKNSGTHWVRYMLSAAIACHHGLPAPEKSSGQDAAVFIAHPKHPPVHPQTPRIGSSHNLPSRLIRILGRFGLVRLPPTVVLVRDIREALLSHYVKWRGEHDLDLCSYVRSPAPGAKRVADVWWYVRFFNLWGAMVHTFGRQVLVVRYEDLQADPTYWVRRIGDHWGLKLRPQDIAAALAVSGIETLAGRLDPTYGEAIVPDRRVREAVRLEAEDMAVLDQVFRTHLKHDFGYGLSG